MERTTTGSATIDVRVDGPYVVSGDCRLYDADGNALPSRGSLALCRCGNSSRKPYCDGTHAKIGFSGMRHATPEDGGATAYRGRRITVHDDRAICAHAGICTDTLPGVFRMGKEPWIDADGAAAEAVIALVQRCPSGALSYSIDGMDPTRESQEPAIFCTTNGPFRVTGGVALRTTDGVMPRLSDRYTLCRCGGSKNKPYCDGTHWAIGFDSSRGRQRGVFVPPLGLRRFGWALGAVLLATVIATVIGIEAAGKWSARGFLGKAPLIADVNLVLHLLLVTGLTFGAWLARRGNIAAHRYNQTIWVLVNAALVVLIMAPGMENAAIESLADLAPVHYWVPWLHALVGGATAVSGLWLVLQMNGFIPRRFQLRAWKGLMRATLAGYWLVAALGVAIYYLWFLR